jgi:hypothetical protein
MRSPLNTGEVCGSLMAEHVSDRYRHSMRYFGLLSPQAKSESSEAVSNHLVSANAPARNE